MSPPNATSPVGAGTPLLDQGIRAVNFFNGRLLTGRDLSREQEARHEANTRLGQATGAGVVQGLEVSRHGDPKQHRLLIKKGLAVSRAGQTLCLGADQVLALVPEADSTPVLSSGTFAGCTVLSGGTYVAGDGLYLVTLAPAIVAEGKAPVLALEPGNVRCNTDVMVEAVQLRLLRIQPELLSAYNVDTNAIAAPAMSLLRSAVAYACFGYPALADAHRQAGITPGPSLLDALRLRGLDDRETPLAVVYLNARDGLVFVDRWAVRRRLARLPATPSVSAWLGEQLDALGEAQLSQFQEHLAELPVSVLAGLNAQAWFGWLPPAGFLDSDGARAVSWDVFLGTRKPARIAGLAPGDVRGVLSQALRRDPVPLDATSTAPRYRVYRIAGSGPWFFVREAPNAPHAEEVWLDGERAHLPGVNDVQSAIDALRARSCGELVLWPGADVHALVGEAQILPGDNLSLCIEAGEYVLDRPLILSGLGHVVVHGTGAGSLLRAKGAEVALLIENCKSVTVRELAVRSDRTIRGKRGDGPGLMGALTVIDTPKVHIDRVSAQCAAGTDLAAAGILVTHTKPHGDGKQRFERSVSVSDCDVAVGANQLGILCLHGELTIVRQNTVRAAIPRQAMQRGIVVAGALAREVRVEDNVIDDVREGITVALSGNEKGDEKGLHVERAVLAHNSVRVRLDKEAEPRRSEGFGIYAGNVDALLVLGNRLLFEDGSGEGTALRLQAIYGPHLVVRDNQLRGAGVAINFEPQEPLPTNVSHLWLFAENFSDTQQLIQCSEEVRYLIRTRDNEPGS